MNLTAEIIIERLSNHSDDLISIRGDLDLNPSMPTPVNLISAAVLIGLIKYPKKISVLLTKRTDHLKHHPGQISFPGGHSDQSDNTPEETALRETEEEIGLHRRQIRTIGRLNKYITRTGFSITPIVAFIEPPYEISPAPYEVEEVFEVPLEFLLDPANHKLHSRKYGDNIREFHALPYGGYYIWGATAGMLVNLYEVLNLK
jgi:8-oxo-dGTP pyrophosphatase MutT (NUDIX family)